MSLERELPIVLDEDEKNASARKCAEEELVLRELEQELRDVSGGLRGKIKKKKAEIKTLALEAETGERKAMVQCEERTDWPNATQVVRLDGRDKEGKKLPDGAPPAVVEEKAPEVQEVEGAAPKPAEDTGQQDLFASTDGKKAAPEADEHSTGPSNGSSDEESEAEEEDDGDEPDPVPPPAAPAAAKGKKPRKLRLVGAPH